MSHRSRPAPKQSAKMQARKPVVPHNDAASVGHSKGAKPGRKPLIKACR